ncbi:hypothetical protein SDC9_155897 [bioreactor metagenome]|uniref:Uncharacterized protein n=1 Tax=bioreactor metagenome TaxID=1076179 RepID=A0A645F7Z9_9ZZZZ
MKFGGEPVPDGHASIFGEFFNNALAIAAVFDAVIHPAEHLRGIRDALLFADLRSAGVEIGCVHAEVKGGNLEGASRPRAGLFKDQRNVLAVQRVVRDARFLLRLQLRREIEKSLDLLRRKVEQLEKALALQVHVLALLFLLSSV